MFVSLSLRSVIPIGGYLTAKYGVNTFIVSYPDIVKQQFPEHVVNSTIYGRLANAERMINVDFALTHDPTVSGCSCFVRSLRFVRSFRSLDSACRALFD